LSEDITDLLHGPVELVVDDLVAVAPGQVQFAFGPPESSLEGRLCLGATTAESSPELFEGLGSDEDTECVGVFLHDAEGPLNVNL
jgi:hypothetical protein